MDAIVFFAVIGLLFALVVLGLRWFIRHSEKEMDRLSKYDGENHVR